LAGLSSEFTGRSQNVREALRPGLQIGLNFTGPGADTICDYIRRVDRAQDYPEILEKSEFAGKIRRALGDFLPPEYLRNPLPDYQEYRWPSLNPAAVGPKAPDGGMRTP
jgi:hypothetical protein